jgi:3-carboxy-cis,cis-muconate cycloisomerase
LARAEARAGIIPVAAVAAIVAKCRAELFDLAALGEAAAQAGNPAIPMVKALTALVEAEDGEAGRFVHWGATSQDAMDSGLVLQLKAALDGLDFDLRRLADLLAGLALRHRTTVLAGRTWLQQGPPVTFGLKAAGWMSAFDRHRNRLAEIRPRLLVLEFGGAVGTLASLDRSGLETASFLAEELGLGQPDLPWHAHRDRLVEIAATVGLVAGSLGKMARDISLLMQNEIGEAFEPSVPGRGGSSAMPHKRNPVGAAVALAAAARVPGLVSTMFSAMVQEHERGLGNWPAEWETLPEVFRLTGGALDQMILVVQGLEVDGERMAANLEVTRGLIHAAAVSQALANRLGAQRAHRLLEEACRRAIGESRHLRDVLLVDPAVLGLMSVSEIDRLFSPSAGCGLAAELVDRALARRGDGMGE